MPEIGSLFPGKGRLLLSRQPTVVFLTSVRCGVVQPAKEQAFLNGWPLPEPLLDVGEAVADRAPRPVAHRDGRDASVF